MGERVTWSAARERVTENEYSDVTAVSHAIDTYGRSDIDILVMSSLANTHINKLTVPQLEEGFRRKERHYRDRGYTFIPGVDDVLPFVMLDNGAMHPKANSWLYEMVNKKYNQWREGHILNALQVQHIRAKLARTVMAWSYFAFESVQRHGLTEMPEGRLETTVEGLMGRHI